jgi:hypothetical protein
MIHDTHPDIPDQGKSFMHCKRCIDELPEGESPMSWARQQLAIRHDGKLQLRCTRHDINIDVISIEPKSSK